MLLEKRAFKKLDMGKINQSVKLYCFALMFDCFSYGDINRLVFLFCSLYTEDIGITFLSPKHPRFVSCLCLLPPHLSVYSFAYFAKLPSFSLDSLNVQTSSSVFI